MAFIENTGSGPSSSALSSSLGSSNLLSLLGPLAAGGGLLYDILGGNSNLPAEGDLSSIESATTGEGASLYNTGNALQQYLVQGTLPPQFQAANQAALSSANASAIQGAGARGQNTNPTQNSALNENLNVNQQQSLITQGQLEDLLYNAGLSDIQAGTSAFNTGEQASQALGTMETQQQTLTMNSIASLAAALGKVSWNTLTL